VSLGFSGELRILDYGRSLEYQLLRSGVLHSFTKAACAENGAKLIEVDLLANVEQKKSNC
jgi:hypothetical protein